MGWGAGEASSARVRYCVVPADLAERLLGPLRERFSEDPGFEVIQERRGSERRSGSERRQAEAPERIPASGDRRRIHNADGRRVAERRAPVVAIEPPQGLPRRARRHAERLVFCERLEISAESREDVETARLVIAFQGGEEEGFSELYRRYFDRVYGYLRLLLKDHHESEDATQEVFVSTLGALPRYERRSQPFRAWLFTIARNEALERLRVRGRGEVHLDPAEVHRKQEEREPPERTALTALDWLSDSDMLILLRRLPPLQREVVVMRFLLDMPSKDIARVLDRSPDAVRVAQTRATNFLRERLVALGHAPERRRGQGMKIRTRQIVVLRRRRTALIG